MNEKPKTPGPRGEEIDYQKTIEAGLRERRPPTAEEIQSARRKLYSTLMMNRRHYKNGECLSEFILAHILGVPAHHVAAVMEGLEGFSRGQTHNQTTYRVVDRNIAHKGLYKHTRTKTGNT